VTVVVSRQPDPDLADVRVRIRRVDRKPVPEWGEAETLPDRNVHPEAEHEPDSSLARSAEAAQVGADRAEPQASSEEEAACGAGIEAQPSVKCADGQRRAIFRFGPSGRADAEQQLGAQRAAE